LYKLEKQSLIFIKYS